MKKTPCITLHLMLLHDDDDDDNGDDDDDDDDDDDVNDNDDDNDDVSSIALGELALWNYLSYREVSLSHPSLVSLECKFLKHSSFSSYT